MSDGCWLLTQPKYSFACSDLPSLPSPGFPGTRNCENMDQRRLLDWPAQKYPAVKHCVTWCHLVSLGVTLSLELEIIGLIPPLPSPSLPTYLQWVRRADKKFRMKFLSFICWLQAISIDNWQLLGLLFTKIKKDNCIRGGNILKIIQHNIELPK